jgi:hypothetical protein
MRARGILGVGLVVTIGCGGARSQRAAEASDATRVTVAVCREAVTPEGNQVDDAPSTVDLVIEGARPGRVRLAQVLTGCWRRPAGAGELGAALCSDPFVDYRTVVVVRRPSPRSVVVEITDIDEGNAPIARRLRRELSVGAETRVDLEIGSPCGPQ